LSALLQEGDGSSRKGELSRPAAGEDQARKLEFLMWEIDKKHPENASFHLKMGQKTRKGA
jgi:hypothetical protein